MMDQNDFNKAIALMVGFLIGAWLALSPVKAQAAYIAVCPNNPGFGQLCTGMVWLQEQTRPTSGYYVDWTTSYIYRDATTYTSTIWGLFCPTADCGQMNSFTGSQFWIDDYQLPALGAPTVSCIPSYRTIAPCPAGYAPSVAEPLSSNPSDQYTSAFDALPLQDMIYALGVALCGLLGVAVGVRLT